MTNQNTTYEYVILGSGIAGMSAAEAIRQQDKEAEILMISDEKELCFNRPMLINEFALDGSGAALFERMQNWPSEIGIQTRLGVTVKSIDKDAKALHLADGSSLHYGKLICTPGARVSIPPIPGADKPHVYTVRTRADMRKIRSAMKTAKSAAVVGGGMLGLEDAWGLCEEKIHVSIIEQKQRVAFGQIDQSAGNLMKKRIERYDAEVFVNVSVQEIGDGWVSFVQMENTGGNSADGQLKKVPADLVILSTGVTPNSEIAEAAGLEMGGPGKKWIAVDDSMHTSDPFIFAAGDAAALKGCNDAIWDEAREMGRVAGINAAGGNAAYIPVVAEHVFKGFDTEVFTMADSSGAGTDGVYIRHADVEIFDYLRERYIRVSLQDGIIAGLLLINASELVPELMAAYKYRQGEEEARRIIQDWKDSHDVNFKQASPFRKR